MNESLDSQKLRHEKDHPKFHRDKQNEEIVFTLATSLQMTTLPLFILVLYNTGKFLSSHHQDHSDTHDEEWYRVHLVGYCQLTYRIEVLQRIGYEVQETQPHEQLRKQRT